MNIYLINMKDLTGVMLPKSMTGKLLRNQIYSMIIMIISMIINILIELPHLPIIFFDKFT